MASSTGKRRYADCPLTSLHTLVQRPTCVEVPQVTLSQALVAGTLHAREALHSDFQAVLGARPKVHADLV